MKRWLCLLMALLMMSSTCFAATYTKIGDSKTPVTIELKDFDRLLEVAKEVQNCNVIMTNAQKINDNTWAVRLQYDRSADVTADYIVSTIPYTWNNDLRKVTSLPFKDIKEGTETYGPNWYYFGVFDAVDHEICGFGLAQRVKRWPSWDDLSFGTGYYSEPCSVNFYSNHLK